MFSVDAVTAPLAINGALSESADWGISNKSLPLPLNDPLNDFASILSDTNMEPLIVVLPIITVLPEMLVLPNILAEPVIIVSPEISTTPTTLRLPSNDEVP